MSDKELNFLINECFEISTKMKELDESLKVKREVLLGMLKQSKYSDFKSEAGVTARIINTTTDTYDIKKVSSLMTEKDFLNAIKLQIGVVRTKVKPSELKKCVIARKTVESIRVSEEKE